MLASILYSLRAFVLGPPQPLTEGSYSAEYHALKDQMKAGTTYYFAYSFAVNKVQDNLMIMQLKEYEANAHGGANIPLSFEINSNGALEFQHQPSGDQGRQVQWTKALEPNKTYKIGLEILAKASGGHAKLWWNGNPATFTTTKTDTITGNMFPGNSSPKFGAYRGEEVTIDTYIYKVQIGTNKADLDASFF